MSPIGSMTSAAEPMFLPALSDVRSLVALAGGFVAAANLLAVVESDTVRVSVVPVVGSELPAVCIGNGALDMVGLRVGPSCLRMDSEETLPALQDKRSVMRFLDLDGGPMEGMPVLEPLQHSVLEMTLDGRPMEGRPVLEPLEHSVLEMALEDGPTAGISVLELLEHPVPDVALDWDLRSLIKMAVSDPSEHSGLGETDDVDLDPLWMAPWDAGGTLGAGSRTKIAIWRDVLCCVARFSRMPVIPVTGYLRYFRGLGRTCILDLNEGETKVPVRMMRDESGTDFPSLQFPPCGVRVLPFPGRQMHDRSGFSPGEPYPGREVCGRIGLTRARVARKNWAI